MAGMSAVARHELQDSAVVSSEMRINLAIRQRFKSLQQAFRRMDDDRDGFLSAQEFVAGVERRLKVKVAPKLLEEIIRRADTDRDGRLSYQEFLVHFRTVPASAALEDGTSDNLSTVELCKLLLQVRLALPRRNSLNPS